MKRIALVAIGLMCLLLCVANGEDAAMQPGVPQQKRAGAGIACEKTIKKLSKRAGYYQKKAGKEKNKELATIYTKCAEAKQKMADGYTKVYENSQKCQTVCSSNPEIMSAIRDGKMKNCMLKRKKRTHMSTHVKKLQKCADICLKNAKQAELDGKKDLAQQYNEFAAAMQAKSEGFKLVAEGKKEFKDARKDLKELK